LVVAKVWERLAVDKQLVKKVDVERFNLKQLNEEEVKKNCLTSGKSQLLYLFIKRVIKLTAVIIEVYHCCQLHTKFYLTFFSLG
jgi:hypothetical protein